MAESNTAKTLSILSEEERSGITTGGPHPDRYLYRQLRDGIARAVRIDIIVSFLMESGVRMLLGDLRAAIERGVPIRILTGNYLGITQPSALYLIRKELGNRIEMRFYSDTDRSFHPKSYILHYGATSDIFIGSSNISRSALTSGIEWNYRLRSFNDPESFDGFCSTFESLWNNHSIVIDDDELRRYSKNWHRPAAEKDLDRYDARDDRDTQVSVLFEPRGAQIEALCALENTRAEGATRALVMAATGIGKTYLAAFDSRPYERILFVAHREEILKQAAESFRNVRLSDDYGFFTGDEKCTDKSVIFASVASLGRKEYLSSRYFAPDYFQYIVVDEFHHAVSNQYRNIIEYFRPQFMLGLTATPDRLDGRNVYELCDYNVAYEIGLKEAINKGMLVPFRYFGIYDDTDYSSLHIVRGRYDEKELNETYIGNTHRHDLIYSHYMKYGSKRALGFCCSRAHAEEMAGEFNRRGIPAVAVYSGANGEYSADRTDAIERLRSGEIRVIFSVDMFNEGVDITCLDMVLFLRPTDSPIVFLQQLGRGLRKSAGKEYLTVLDFIGNYEKAGRIRFLLTDRRNVEGRSFDYTKKDDYPDDCQIDFDLKLIDLFREMDGKQQRLSARLAAEYFRVKDILGKQPTRKELFTYMDDDVYRMAITRSKDNPFRDYLGFLKAHGELSPAQQAICDTVAYDFLKMLETTSMTKVYKMPVLQSFLTEDGVRTAVTAEEILVAWKRFFDADGNWKDLDTDMTYERYRGISDKKHISKIMTMPVNFLIKSGLGYFTQPEGYAIAMNPELAALTGLPGFAEELRDVTEYRAIDYYHRRYLSKTEE